MHLKCALFSSGPGAILLLSSYSFCTYIAKMLCCVCKIYCCFCIIFSFLMVISLEWKFFLGMFHAYFLSFYCVEPRERKQFCIFNVFWVMLNVSVCVASSVGPWVTCQPTRTLGRPKKIHIPGIYPRPTRILARWINV